MRGQAGERRDEERMRERRAQEAQRQQQRNFACADVAEHSGIAGRERRKNQRGEEILPERDVDRGARRRIPSIQDREQREGEAGDEPPCEPLDGVIRKRGFRHERR